MKAAGLWADDLGACAYAKHDGREFDYMKATCIVAEIQAEARRAALEEAADVAAGFVTNRDGSEAELVYRVADKIAKNIRALLDSAGRGT